MLWIGGRDGEDGQAGCQAEEGAKHQQGQAFQLEDAVTVTESDATNVDE